MNILMVSSGSEFYGGEKIMLLLAKFLINKGERVFFLLPESGKFSKILKKHDIKFYMNGSKNSFDIRSVIKIKRIVKKENINVIHSHGFNANIFSRIAGSLSKIKVISTVHVIQEFGKEVNFFKRNWYKFIDIFTAMIRKENNIITAVSPSVKGSLAYLNRNIFLIPNGVEEPGLDYKIPESIKNIGFIGRIVNIKGIEELIIGFSEVIRKHKQDLSLIIAGEDITPDKIWEIKYKKLINDLNISEKVNFVGFIENIEAFYKKVDAIIIPSYKEPFGLVLLEALKRNKPVITTNNSGPEYILKDYYPDYFLIESGSSEVLYEALKKLCNLDKEEIAEIFDEKLKNRLKFFDQTKMLESYYEIYKGE